MSQLLRRLARRLDVDRAVFVILLGRAWQVAAGPVTLVLIATFLTAELQGFYYTFASLIATQTFVELGLSLVILNIASHESERITLQERGELAGDPAAIARIGALGRFIVKWYSMAALVFMGLAGTLGYWFLASSGSSVEWKAQWVCMVLVAGAQFVASPFNTLLEGCGKVELVNRLRLWQSVASNVVLWVALTLGVALWAPVLATLAVMLLNVGLLAGRFPRLFSAVRLAGPTKAIDWRTEIWPLQWRFAVQGIVNYFIFSLFTPVVFRYHGAEDAGRIGMTIQLMSILQGGALAWLQAKTPAFGALVARRAYDELDRMWLRLSIISSGVLVAGGVVLLAAITLLPSIEPRLAERLLGPGPTLVLFLGYCALHAVVCMAVYLRSHKREPLVWVGVVSGILCGIAIWHFGRTQGAPGAAAAYAAVLAFFNLPLVTLIWFRCRRAWHAAEEQEVARP